MGFEPVSPTDYLKLRGRTWFVRVQIPAHLRAAAEGKREYIKTLKTRDRDTAERLKHAYVAAFKGKIAAMERHKPHALGELYEKALAWRAAMEQHGGDVLYKGDDDEEPYTAADEFLSHISEEANEFLETHGEKAATNFFKIAKGEGTPLSGHIETWLTEQAGTVTAQTSAQHRTVLNAFLNSIGETVLIEDVHRRQAGEYVSALLAPTSGLSRKTAQRYVSSLSSLWTWLGAMRDFG